MKQRVSDDVAQLWNDIDSRDGDGDGSGDDDVSAAGDDEEDIFDPTYELAASRRSGQGGETSKAFVQNSRNNFRTEVSGDRDGFFGLCLYHLHVPDGFLRFISPSFPLPSYEFLEASIIATLSKASEVAGTPRAKSQLAAKRQTETGCGGHR